MDFPRFYNTHIEAIRDTEFPSLREQTYVDHAGTTLYAKSQLDAHHQDLMRHVYGNPHSRSASSQLTADTIEQIRYRVLQFFNTSSSEYSVIFTSGCTQALKLVAETFNFSANPGEPVTDVQKETGDNVPWMKGDNSKECLKNGGYFYYLCDNHTSAQGMREIIVKRTENMFCLDLEDLSKTLVAENIPGGEMNQNNLFVFPAQSNYSGQKYPLVWIDEIQNNHMKCQKNTGGQWYVLLDAAAFASTSLLDLGSYKPDFVTVSFYKIFGYPTGLGALLVRNKSSCVLKKEYFGGGTVAVSSAKDKFHVFRNNISERFEDGTLPFLDIIAVRHGLDIINKVAGGMMKISQHTFTIVQFFHHHLQKLCHSNGKPLAEFYSDGDFQDISKQGSTINFNLRRSNGDYIGFAEVDKMAQLHNVHLRTGCFCNIGACQKYLHISTQQLKNNFQDGHVCGDDKDLVNGQPTGSVRISFGYMSTLADAVKCLQFVIECFVEGSSTNLYIDIAKDASDIINKNSQSSQSASSLILKKHPEGVSKDIRCTGADVPSVPACPSDVLQRCTENSKLLTNIFLYPVKSCAAFEVKEWQIGSKGLMYDREWMIVSDSSVTITQKREPKLCLLKPNVDLSNNQLHLDFPGMHRLSLSLEYGNQAYTGQICANKICGDKVETYDCGEEASDWISLALGRSGCRLLRQQSEDTRTSKLKDNLCESKAGSELSLANESQFLLISRESVKALMKKIQEQKDQNFEESKERELLETAELEEDNVISRFRANLVFGGGLYFEEDNWRDFSIGENQMVSQGGCTRCQMICLDQETGNRSKEPLRTLASWRGQKVPFGIHVRMAYHSKTHTTVSVGVPVITR